MLIRLLRYTPRLLEGALFAADCIADSLLQDAGID